MKRPKKDSCFLWLLAFAVAVVLIACFIILFAKLCAS